MFEVLSQLSTMDLTVILWVSMAFSVLGLVVIARMLTTLRRARDRRILVGLVLGMLEQGFAPVEITGLLRAMGIHHGDDQFPAACRRLFRRYTKRKTLTPPPLPDAVTLTRREFQPLHDVVTLACRELQSAV